MYISEPKQHAPSGGLHCIFDVDGEQAKRINSKTCTTHKGTISYLSLQVRIAVLEIVLVKGRNVDSTAQSAAKNRQYWELFLGF